MKQLERHRGHDFIGPVVPEACRLEGGDVMRTAEKLLAGESSRTNTVGIGSRRRELTPLGYSVEAVKVRLCLNLKSAGAAVGVSHDRNLTPCGNPFARSE